MKTWSERLVWMGIGAFLAVVVFIVSIPNDEQTAKDAELSRLTVAASQRLETGEQSKSITQESDNSDWPYEGYEGYKSSNDHGVDLNSESGFEDPADIEVDIEELPEEDGNRRLKVALAYSRLAEKCYWMEEGAEKDKINQALDHIQPIANQRSAITEEQFKLVVSLLDRLGLRHFMEDEITDDLVENIDNQLKDEAWTKVKVTSARLRLVREVSVMEDGDEKASLQEAIDQIKPISGQLVPITDEQFDQVVDILTKIDREHLVEDRNVQDWMKEEGTQLLQEAQPTEQQTPPADLDT